MTARRGAAEDGKFMAMDVDLLGEWALSVEFGP